MRSSRSKCHRTNGYVHYVPASSSSVRVEDHDKRAWPSRDGYNCCDSWLDICPLFNCFVARPSIAQVEARVLPSIPEHLGAKSHGWVSSTCRSWRQESLQEECVHSVNFCHQTTGLPDFGVWFPSWLAQPNPGILAIRGSSQATSRKGSDSCELDTCEQNRQPLFAHWCQILHVSRRNRWRPGWAFLWPGSWLALECWCLGTCSHAQHCADADATGEFVPTQLLEGLHGQTESWGRYYIRPEAEAAGTSCKKGGASHYPFDIIWPYLGHYFCPPFGQLKWIFDTPKVAYPSTTSFQRKGIERSSILNKAISIN